MSVCSGIIRGERHDTCLLHSLLTYVCRYLFKNLGVQVCDSPLTVRLLFEPSGRAVDEVGQYYTQEKANQCVVCGSNGSYIRKNVVPREYRKHFPGKLLNCARLLLCCFMWGCHVGCVTPFMLHGKAALCVFRFHHFSRHFVFVHLPVTFLNMLRVHLAYVDSKGKCRSCSSCY